MLTKTTSKINYAGFILLLFIFFPLLFLYVEKKNKHLPELTKTISNSQTNIAPVNLDSSLQAVKTNPCFDTYFKLGFDYYKNKQYAEAASANLEALKFNPNSDVAWNNLCSAYNELHEWERAVVAGKKALQLNPNSELAKNNLAWAEKNKER